MQKDRVGGGESGDQFPSREESACIENKGLLIGDVKIKRS